MRPTPKGYKVFVKTKDEVYFKDIYLAVHKDPNDALADYNAHLKQYPNNEAEIRQVELEE